MGKTVIGIHSNVTGGDLTGGHAWISVTRDGVTTNYGLWPDSHPGIEARGWNNGNGSDIRTGMEDGDRPAASRYAELTPEQATALEASLRENVAWGYTANCSSWASETFNRVTGQSLNADEPYTAGVLETPRQLGQSIRAAERTQPTTLSTPAPPQAPRRSSSDSLSDAGAPGETQQAALSARGENLLNVSQRLIDQHPELRLLPVGDRARVAAAMANGALGDGLPDVNRFAVKNGNINYGFVDGQNILRADGTVPLATALKTPEAVSLDGLRTDNAAAIQQQVAPRVAFVEPPVAQRAV